MNTAVWLVVAILSCAVPFCLLLAFRNFISGRLDGSFDVFGVSWIVLKSLYYGWCILWFVIAVSQRSSTSKLVVCLAISFISLVVDRLKVNAGSDTAVDYSIQQLGYFISRLHPYEAHDDPVPSSCHAALPPSSVVVAKCRGLEVAIESGTGLLRKISWHGATRAIAAQPLLYTAFPYVVGLVFPIRGVSPLQKAFPPLQEENWPGDFWENHEGITRCVFAEVTANFDSQKAAEDWLSSRCKLDNNLCWNNSGLTVSVHVDTFNHSIRLRIIQILINGHKPNIFAPSASGSVTVTKLGHQKIGEAN